MNISKIGVCTKTELVKNKLSKYKDIDSVFIIDNRIVFVYFKGRVNYRIKNASKKYSNNLTQYVFNI